MLSVSWTIGGERGSLLLASDRSYRRIPLAQVAHLLVSAVAWRNIKGLTGLGLFSDRFVK
jgi:hypothetical protein